MPPKKNKKTKSKRYSCDMCTEIDNARMIQCDHCGSKYHLKCVNIQALDEKDGWMCFECLMKDLSRPPKSSNNDQTVQSQSKPMDYSKTRESQVDTERGVNGHQSHKSDVKVGHNTETQSQAHNSQKSVKNSQTTRSSVRRRTQLELDRLEEERQLKEKRDKEYLDSKYRILLEDRDNKSKGSGSERRSTDRSSFTREWIQRQTVDVQQPSASHIPPMNKEGDYQMPWNTVREFGRRIDEFTFENTSPRNQQTSSFWKAHQMNQPKRLTETKTSEAPSERQQNQMSKFTRANPVDIRSTSNQQNIPCPTHDARQFMFQEVNATANTGIPCSNSTFAVPQRSEVHLISNQGMDQRSRPISPESTNVYTLEWDNYVGTQRGMERDPNLQPKVRMNDKYSLFGTKGDSARESEHQSDNKYAGMQKFMRSFGKSNRDVESSQYRDRQSNFKESNFNDDTVYLSNNEQSKSNRRSTSNQGNRRVEFEESEDGHRDRSSVLSVENQPKTSYTPDPQANGNIMAAQIAARHVVDKRLPYFFGDPNEWPIWYNQYKNSTKLCGFTNGENLDRLEKCIKGKARDSVRGRLIHPESVPWIIETLEMLYGRPEVIIKSIITKIREYPSIKSEKLEQLMDFAFEVQTICTTIESLDCNDHLKDPMLIEELVDKLPTQEKKDWARYKAGMANVTLKTLSIWLYDLAKLLSTVATPRITKTSDRKPEKDKSERNERTIGLEHVNVHVSQTNRDGDHQQVRQKFEKSPQKKFPCPVCNNECGKVENCSKFNSFDVDGRWKALNEYKLCRRCLKRHKNPCRATNVCGKGGCTYKHHSLLHNNERHSPPKSASTANTTLAPSNFHSITNISTMLRIVPVMLYNGTKSVFTFAFFDEGTTITMMENWLANELGLNGTSEQICLIWTNKIHRRERAERVSLEISGINEFNKRYELKGVRTVDELHLPAQSVNRKELIVNYPYLKDIPFVNYDNAVPGIMIGSDMPKFGTQLQIVESEDVENDEFNGPMASRTRLGWSVHGPRNGSTTNEHVNVHQFEICPHHNELDNEIHQRVKEYFSVENFGVQANSKINLESKDNERALEMLNRLSRKKNGRFETGLLWKSNNVVLPDSYPMALKRLVSLERQSPEMVQILGAKVADYVAKGYARKLTQKELEYDGPVWYLPLFGVIHPKKPTKVRMVFDAAAKVKNVSLNSALLQGPDLYTSLIDILRRFRERLFTGGGDIAEMFHQVNIIDEDRHFQRFLFRDNKTKEPEVYRMEVMTFGATCSPSSAQFIKNKNASEFIGTHPRAVNAIIDSHYVDDLMECEHTEKEMIQLLEDVKMIHAEGGFNIRNFISNSENVLKALGENASKEVKDITLKSELKVERVLGMWYNTKTDMFTFSLKYTLIDKEIFNGSKLPTKREILRTLMSIFDPLGLLSNFLIHLKILLQEVWRTQMDWDERLSSKDLAERWKRWLAILPEVENVKVPRLYSPKMSPNTPKSIQMHVFVDASEDAFTALVYFRIEDDDGVDVAFVGSKARVAPLKYLSIPRKELQGCVLGTRLSTSIRDAQRFKIDRRTIWTDSATVISWLNSDHRKYSQFVGHRVGEILENSDVHEWRWIPTKENVADEATKWTKAPNFDSSNRWFRGPEFLRQSEDQWPEKKRIESDVEEEMKANYVHSSLLLPRIIDPERFSKYKRMVRSLAYAIRFINLFTGKAKKGEPLQQVELRRAETLIFRQAQFEGYPSEMVTLERNKVLPIDKQKFIEKPSPLHDGTPYLDADSILRMKGRIDGARELSMDSKRPIVLPRESRITKLLLSEFHSEFFHQNHETVVNEVRQRFYIPRLRVILKKTRKDCQMCKIKKAHPIPPQMADLPKARLATRFVPYSYVGIDFFGPLFVTVGRHTEKRWGVLFTCLTIRAIHIEIAPGLDTNSCILCIQNFIADHGPVIEFHSDCGTNFKGSDNVLQEEISKIDPVRLQTEFTTTYTKWIFNPPASPHMGGSWERLIRTVKSAMYEVMPTRTPKEDMLRNLLKQIQNVVNSRPLTFIPLDVEGDEALTPNHFIKLSSNGSKPSCEIELDGPYLRESWKESQRLTELFWKRFVKEYLPTIARRTKWHKLAEPLKKDDLVLIVDGKNPRNTYPKAKILQTEVGSNGQVRRAKVTAISSTRTNANGQITKVNKIDLWRPAHKLALLDVVSKGGLAQPGLDRETGGSVKSKNIAPSQRESTTNPISDASSKLPGRDFGRHSKLTTLRKIIPFKRN